MSVSEKYISSTFRKFKFISSHERVKTIKNKTIRAIILLNPTHIQTHTNSSYKEINCDYLPDSLKNKVEVEKATYSGLFVLNDY